MGSTYLINEGKRKKLRENAIKGAAQYSHYLMTFAKSFLPVIFQPFVCIKLKNKPSMIEADVIT